jgi:hypothetical protein
MRNSAAYNYRIAAATIVFVCIRRRQMMHKSRSKFNTPDDALQTLCDGFNRSRNGMDALEFECDNLTLKISKKKQILHGVSSTLKPGHVRG